MRLIDADALKESMGKPKDEIDEKINKVISDFIDTAPTVTLSEIQSLMGEYLAYMRGNNNG